MIKSNSIYLTTEGTNPYFSRSNTYRLIYVTYSNPWSDKVEYIYLGGEGETFQRSYSNFKERQLLKLVCECGGSNEDS
jgi:hypothetical protein